MEKNREDLQLYIEADHKREGEVKPLTFYLDSLRKFSTDYPPEMIREVYEEVIREIKGGNPDG